MLLVRVELWPGGDRHRRREVAVLTIANVTELSDVSDYAVVRVDDSGRAEAAFVRGHRRADGLWPLISRACSLRTSRRVPARHARVVEALTNLLLSRQ